MIKLTAKEVYHLILQGSAGKGWLGFAEDIQKALMEKNNENSL